ncbi:MAG: hypothetical protein Q7R83_02400, partial [bacterium]|nr:hypothetical protein [bacterium]
QKAVELEYDKEENKPKKFIGDLMPKMLEKMKAGSQEDWLKYLQLATGALETKEIQLFATRADEEAMIERYGWTGQLKQVGGDVLSIVEANIGGQKTDAVIDETVDHAVKIQDDGSVFDTVTITRKHNGQRGELFRGANNVSYLRVYVPQGSELLSASGFMTPTSSLFQALNPDNPTDADIQRLIQDKGAARMQPEVTVSNEFGRTAFGGWVQVGPGKEAVTTFTYRLPFTVGELAKQSLSGTDLKPNRAVYTLLLTSQSGKENRTINSHVEMPVAWKMLWNNRQAEKEGEKNVVFSGTWDRDYVMAGLFETYAQDGVATP